MIHDLDKTLEKVLVTVGKVNKSEIDISFDQPHAEWTAQLNRPTINCWCYDIRENKRLRNFRLDSVHDGKKAISKPPPLRFDLAYQVTAWARKIEDEHQLLWHALSTFAQVNRLDPNNCEGSLKRQEYEIPVTVGFPNEIEQYPSSTDLWSVLNNEMRLGFTIMVTLALDTGRELEAPIVVERRLRFGNSEDPRTHENTFWDSDVVRRAEKHNGDAGAASDSADQASPSKKKKKEGD